MTNATTIHPKLHHVNLTTTRLQEMIDWYGLVIGLKPTFHFPGGAWLTNDEANHRLALLAMPGLSDDPQKRAHTGIHHQAYEFDTLAELLATYARLKTHGILPAVTLDHGMTLSFYYPDPDGNLLELQVDNFGDWAASTEWMATSPQFAANPVGVQFDPEKLVEALAAGLSHEEIHRCTYAGEYAPANPVELGVG
jgi:catechol-2,3-dioxygenase